VLDAPLTSRPGSTPGALAAAEILLAAGAQVDADTARWIGNHDVAQFFPDLADLESNT
jgi:hypothetical protein